MTLMVDDGAAKEFTFYSKGRQKFFSREKIYIKTYVFNNSL